MTIRISQLETKVKELIQTMALSKLEQEEAAEKGINSCGVSGTSEPGAEEKRWPDEE